MTYLLQHLLTESARRSSSSTALISGETQISYGELDELTNSLASVIRAQEVLPGDRIGIYVPKSVASIVSVFGILKADAVYVPLDPNAPPERLAYIIRDAGIATLLTTSAKADRIAEMFPDNNPLRTIILVDCDHPVTNSQAPSTTATTVVSWETVLSATRDVVDERAIESDTAYILYTSGSTGSPKGVMISHRNSLTFVNWAADLVGLTDADRVSSHAPLHFDLSIFDIFSSCRAGAAVVIVPEGSATFPKDLARLIERQRISVWYSVPSVLTLLVLFGNLGAHDLSSLRTIIFAGEVFPTKYLRQLMALLPGRRYLNWYGPTETNVCTYYDVPALDSDRTVPIPIGIPCRNTDAFAVDTFGARVTKPGGEGELYVRGPSLMQGYWGDPAKTAGRLIRNPFQPHFEDRVYRTGDLVRLDDDGNFIYLGREDGMVKTRGYRVELGEIETVLYEHPGIKEAAVLPVAHDIFGTVLRAVISPSDGYTLTRENIVGHCASRLPNYMIPDVIEFRDELPKTSTGKTDRVTLSRSAQMP